MKYYLLYSLQTGKLVGATKNKRIAYDSGHDVREVSYEEYSKALIKLINR